MSGRIRRICKCMRQSNETDQQIIERVLRNGRKADYALLVDRYGARLFAFVATMVTRREDAEELAQDCFVKAFRRLAQYDATRSSFYPRTASPMVFPISLPMVLPVDLMTCRVPALPR